MRAIAARLFGKLTMGHAELTLHSEAATRRISLDEYWMPFTPNRDFKPRSRRWWCGRKGCTTGTTAATRSSTARRACSAARPAMGAVKSPRPSARSCAQLDFVAPFTRGHPKQFELATRVAELTPGDLNRIFFTNSGSEAVDTAMKVALAYHQARGQGGRTMFVSRERAYHGVNFGGVSLSGMVNNRRKFGPTLPGIAHMRHTHLPANRFTPGEGTHGVELAEDLLRFVNLYGAENIAACFVEPIAGFDRLPGAAEGLSAAAARHLRPARHPARVRRGDHRASGAPAPISRRRASA